MSLALPADPAFWILGGCLIALLVAAVVAVRAYIQSRRAPYFFLRQGARARSKRAVWAILLLLVVMISVALAAR